ncbi:MAG TPA: hypothetical protein VGC56_00240 [Allosphingosinicella sp.]|jgi:ElaB/YqjD/DUF883 family membrane-anchored ribosome-binding protein
MATTSDNARTSANSSGTAGSAGGNSGGGAADEGGALSSVRQSGADAYQAARDRTSAAYSAARERAGSVGQRTAEGIDSAPMVAIAGGLALGALLGALLPRSSREEELLRPVGQKLSETARGAIDNARETARDQIGDLGGRAADALRSATKS